MTVADAPTTWQDPPPESLLHLLLTMAGIPLLVIAVIVVLVMAPSLARGPRYRPGQDWTAESEWFGAPHEVGAGSSASALQIEALPGSGSSRAGGSGATAAGDNQDRGTGGASAGW